MEIRIKRVYESPATNDGYRVLVDRVWPRGRTKEEVQADRWLKTLAPSTRLRKWFNHDSDKWEAFKHHYFEELRGQQDAIEQLTQEAGQGPITLLYSARDTEHNQAVALREYLTREFIENH
ncbi:DUF488 domain-containing protein [Saccharospirillum salsuginis]|uniref:DUF488 domain-containing protein n=1 Tax=Saccharospirillum salsuginis TaxID=418750 RepID=A0A918KD11_9GAMM|nr:DUF488 family protein [Saccharospirillum salsuginis]GGX59162.1 hypothetical protein GCM10007392_28660 [Saccharospirillum salsuginis]